MVTKVALSGKKHAKVLATTAQIGVERVKGKKSGKPIFLTLTISADGLSEAELCRWSDPEDKYRVVYRKVGYYALAAVCTGYGDTCWHHAAGKPILYKTVTEAVMAVADRYEKDQVLGDLTRAVELPVEKLRSKEIKAARKYVHGLAVKIAQKKQAEADKAAQQAAAIAPEAEPPESPATPVVQKVEKKVKGPKKKTKKAKATKPRAKKTLKLKKAKAAPSKGRKKAA